MCGIAAAGVAPTLARIMPFQLQFTSSQLSKPPTLMTLRLACLFLAFALPWLLLRICRQASKPRRRKQAAHMPECFGQASHLKRKLHPACTAIRHNIVLYHNTYA